MATYPNQELNPKWVQSPITDEVVQWCKSFAEYLSPQSKPQNGQSRSEPLTTSQLRKFFGQIRLIESDVVTHKAELAMLKPYLAYAVGRDKKKTRIDVFAAQISKALDGIRKDDEHIKEDFKNFISIYEAIVAYHKFYGGKE